MPVQEAYLICKKKKGERAVIMSSEKHFKIFKIYNTYFKCLKRKI